MLPKIAKSLSVRDQLDRASTSIPLNIAEGNGKFTGDDRCRFFDMARGSALESAAALDVLVAKGCCAGDEIRPGKDRPALECRFAVSRLDQGQFRLPASRRQLAQNIGQIRM